MHVDLKKINFVTIYVILRSKAAFPRFHLQLTGLLLILLLSVSNGAAAAEETSIQFVGGDTHISKDAMVWHADDANGKKQIYYKNLSTGETKQITNTDAHKTFPKVSGQLVVWQEKRDVGNPEWDWSIILYDLSNGTEKKLSTVTGVHVEPKTDGRYVTWHRNDGFQVYLYDSVSGEIKQIGTGDYPFIAKGKVLYGHKSGLALYDLGSGQTREIATPPIDEYVTWSAFNGDTALYIQKHNDGKTKYVMLDVNANPPAPIDLTPMTLKERNFTKLVVGDKYVAWTEDKNGVAQIMAADVKSGTVTQQTNAAADQFPLAMLGDRILFTQNFGTVQASTIVQPISGDRTPESSQESEQPSIRHEIGKGKIGPSGGRIELKEQGVFIEFAENAFKKETEVEILAGESTIGTKLRPRMKRLSGIWVWKGDNALDGKASMTIRFDASSLLPDQMKKAALYRYDEQEKSWQYVGGRVDTSQNTVRADVKSSGTFTVLLYDSTFTDVIGHWARLPIEVLAARHILNGMEEDSFQPNDKLTRAQFAKMLAAAMELRRVNPVSVFRFADVTEKHWAYDWIETAAQAGLIEGGDDGFQPDAELSREQMVAMLIRAIGKTQEAERTDYGVVSGYADAGRISPWARGYVALAVKIRLMEGSSDGLRPNDSTSRAEAAAVLFRMLIQLEKI